MQLSKASKEFGIGDYFLFQDFVVENSVYPQKNRTDKEIAWTGVGQSALQITPLHMCMITSSIANDGVMMEPKLLLKATSINNEQKAQFTPKQYLQPLSRVDADVIADYMNQVVSTGTGTRANVAGHRICGKTGTAEVDSQKESNAWLDRKSVV